MILHISILTARLLAAAALLASPASALASGNNLTLSAGVTFSTTNPPPGGSGSMSGGYATTPGGACYDHPTESLGLAQTRIIYALAPTAAPSSPELIFGDQEFYLAEDTNGHLVVGKGKVFSVSGAAINDGAWHKLTAFVWYGLNGYLNVTASLNANGVAGFAGNYQSTNSTMNPASADTNLGNLVTGIGGGPVKNSAGVPLTTFGGSLAEATCLTDTYNNPLGTWPLSANGSDTSSPAQIPTLNQYNTYSGPSGGFPLQ